MVLMVILFSVIGCGSSNKKASTPPVISNTISSDCNTAIETFNKSATGNIIDEIATINNTRKKIPEDLRQLYPKARDAWNKALESVKSNYTKDFTAMTLEPLTIRSYSNWKSEWLEDYQKFFLLLAEYRYGDYPSGSKDTLKRLAWIEKADAKERLEGIVKNSLNSRCRNSNEEVRILIKPALLPENIEDCVLKK
jgi:hypothetical protein